MPIDLVINEKPETDSGSSSNAARVDQHAAPGDGTCKKAIMTASCAASSSELSSADAKMETETPKPCASFLPCQLLNFLRLLYRYFGGYVPMVIMQYGVNQGFGMSVGSMARRYYFLQVLHLDGADIGRYTTAAMVPWHIKPVMGMFSDSLPIFGFRRTSYIAIAGICGLVAYSSLGLLSLTAIASVPLLFLANVSIATPDVMIDATTAELSKDSAQHASDLQSLSWGSLALGGIFACSSSGLLVETVGPKVAFVSITGCSLAILIPSMLRWLPESRLQRAESRLDLSVLRKHKYVTMLASLMTLVSLSLSVLQVAVDNPHVRGIFTVTCGAMIAIAAYVALRSITPLLAQTALFIFMRECLQPGLGEAMFVWLSDSPEGPQFSAKIMGWMDCFGYLGLLIGITIYNKYLTGVSYRKIFLIAQVAMVFSNFFDFVLVKRWNLRLGIPDVVFIVGDDTFTTVMGRFFSMPMMVLAAKVCPDNIEATLFALLMALSNFGNAVSSFFGVTLLETFGIVGDNFDRLPEAILAKSMCRLLPIPLIFLLVPNLTPIDPIPAESSEPTTDQATTKFADGVDV